MVVACVRCDVGVSMDFDDAFCNAGEHQTETCKPKFDALSPCLSVLSIAGGQAHKKSEHNFCLAEKSPNKN